MSRYSFRDERLLERIIETDGIKKIRDAITAVISGSVDVSDRFSTQQENI